MPRKPRFNLPGVPQHVVQRGNNREPCFYEVDDYFRYLDDLHDAPEKNRVAIRAYVLMTNHVYLLVTPSGEFGITHMPFAGMTTNPGRYDEKLRVCRLNLTLTPTLSQYWERELFMGHLPVRNTS